MDERENQETQSEIEINLFAEEEFKADEPPAASDEEITVDFGEAAESMLEDIKADTDYVPAPEIISTEDINPEEISSETVVNVHETPGDDTRGQLTVGPEPDELSEAIDIAAPEDPVEYAEEDVDDEELAYRSRRRLRRVLVFSLIILAVLAAIIGLFIWRNTTPPDVKLPDSDALQISTAGANNTQFQAIAPENIPDLVSYFGLTPEQAIEQSGNEITLDASSSPSTDSALPEVKSTRNGWIVSPSGQTLASVTFGLNDGGNIVYIFTSFDLDAYGVADAKFDELAASNVVAASVLTGIGLDDATVSSAQLTTAQNPDAVVSRDSAGQEIVTFSGPTNLGGAPTQWKLTETYDHTTGVTLGDNSVIRSLSVDLR